MDVRFVRAATYAVIAIAMAVLVGAATFVVGRGTADVDAAFDQGWAAGEGSARGAAHLRYGEGGPGRAQIDRAAFARGRAQGLEDGRRRGFAAGRRAGLRKGEQLAFAGFEGGWRVGRWYAVRIGQGEGALGYSIPSRVPLAGGRAYRLCGSGLCSVAAAPVTR
jgi:hypothetical protein